MMAGETRPHQASKPCWLQCRCSNWLANHKSWIGNLVFGLLSSDFPASGKEYLAQIHLAASYAHLTTYPNITAYLDQCMDGTIALLAVIKDILVFERAVESVQKTILMVWICHPVVSQLSPQMFPNLAMLAFFWSKENPSMTRFMGPNVIPGAIIFISLLMWDITRSSVQCNVSHNATRVLRKYGITGYAKSNFLMYRKSFWLYRKQRISRQQRRPGEFRGSFS